MPGKILVTRSKKQCRSSQHQNDLIIFIQEFYSHFPAFMSVFTLIALVSMLNTSTSSLCKSFLVLTASLTGHADKARRTGHFTRRRQWLPSASGG